MCGIVGFLDEKISLDKRRELLQMMSHALEHRGPDDAGVWMEPESGVGLAHRRLSIVDLSHEGHQPMFSTSKRFCIVFNGEIYNFLALREELEKLGRCFHSHSDTEVLLEAIDQWGLEKTVQKLNGMFAFALWDRETKCLHLVRDRMGEKPLYYGWAGKVFLFGSELKALRLHPAFKAEMDPTALGYYLQYSYVPSPWSIYRDIYKLPPASILTIPSKFLEKPKPIEYWSAEEVAQKGIQDPFCGSFNEATAQLEFLLKDATKLRMIADVPLGALLSGGVDSSCIVALMQSLSDRPIKTFSIGFQEQGFNEARYAKAVAQHLKTEHMELYVTPDQARAVIPQLPTLYDEPFADSSQIPTFLISKLTRHYVTVGLSGDGGDELFGGYNRYFMGPAIWKKIAWLPRSLRKGIAGALKLPTPHQWNQLTNLFYPFLKQYGEKGSFADKFDKLSGILDSPDTDALYQKLVSTGPQSEEILRAGNDYSYFSDKSDRVAFPDFIRKMMFLDQVCYLPDDILTKVDRASMGVSLEVRIPLLDHRVVEFAWRVPLLMKIQNGENKRLLRQILYQYVPKSLIERPKMGFAVPIDSWLRGPLRDWAEALLDEKKLKQEGLFRSEVIRKKWTEHLSGKRNWQSFLWNVLMFESWFKKWMN